MFCGFPVSSKTRRILIFSVEWHGLHAIPYYLLQEYKLDTTETAKIRSVYPLHSLWRKVRPLLGAEKQNRAAELNACSVDEWQQDSSLGVHLRGECVKLKGLWIPPERENINIQGGDDAGKKERKLSERIHREQETSQPQQDMRY